MDEYHTDLPTILKKRNKRSTSSVMCTTPYSRMVGKSVWYSSIILLERNRRQYNTQFPSSHEFRILFESNSSTRQRGSPPGLRSPSQSPMPM
jgi:hypothetical protein